MPRISETERSLLYFLYHSAVRDDPEASAGNKRVSSYILCGTRVCTAVKPYLSKLERAEKSLAVVIFDSSHSLLFEIAKAW